MATAAQVAERTKSKGATVGIRTIVVHRSLRPAGPQLAVGAGPPGEGPHGGALPPVWYATM